MKIRTRIALLFIITVSVILVIFALTVYIFSSNHRKAEFNSRLKEKATNTVKLLSDVDEVDNKLLKIIDQSAVKTLPEGLVLIYDDKDKLVYSNPDNHNAVTNFELLNKIKLEKEVKFNEDNREGVGLLFVGKYDHYVVIAKAYDKSGLSKLNYLKYLMLSVMILTVILILVVSFLFSKQVLNPVSEMVNQLDNITISNLDLRLNEGNGSDEIAQLAIKFNKMLERLDSAFEIQRSFVANASHELRTPLTALTGQLEVALMKKEDNDAWEVLDGLLKEIKQLNKLSNGLLELAHASLDISEIKIRTLRIDELLGSARADLIKRNKDYTLKLNFNDFPEEENWLQLNGNEQLLKSAFINVIENACKYSSDKTAEIDLKFDQQNIVISISDKGIGINEKDLKNIFEPFFRSTNARNYSGHGIGLTLTKKIVELHKGIIQVSSQLKAGTSVVITIPHL
jgi:signal transduction histidine kinase